MNTPIPIRLAKADAGDAPFARRLRREVDGEVLFDAASRGRYATDASIYQIEPIGVVVPRTEEAARTAIAKPAEAEGVAVNGDALERIVQETRGYPYFLQEWGKHAWDTASQSPITLRDVGLASTSAIAALDESFFRVRFDRLTPLEKRYLRAMAELGPGPHRSGDIAEQLKRDVTALGPTRNQLIAKGMIWSPSHGDTAFTVPLFDEFMRRIMPGDDWRT